MRTHADVMVVVLNHIDTVPEDRRDAMVDDVRRLLAADGIPDVPVIPISARHGIGIDQLKGEIEKRVAGGCHLTRDPVALLEQAGLEIVDRTERYLPGPAVARPWVYGYRLLARRPAGG